MTAFDKKKDRSTGSTKRTGNKGERAPERSPDGKRNKKPEGKGSSAARSRISGAANPVDRGERGTTGPAAI